MSQFNGFYYHYENNTYIRSNFNFVAYVFPLSALLIELIALIKYRRNLSKRMLLPLIIFVVLPMWAGIMQFFIHGVSITGMTIVVMTVVLYCFSVFDTNEIVEQARQRELDILKEKQEMSEMMISQTTSALAEAIDAKDKYTQGHSRRVAEYSVMIAKIAGKSREECDELYLIALLHDVGKIGIPDNIINKEGRLTDEEYAVIKTHPSIGRDILSKINISPQLAIGASFHHERYDGKGYPFGLKGEEIPELARIIACADAYDAMASKRSYRDVLPKEVIRAEFEKNLGKQFDPRFGKIMIGLIDSDRDYEMREK
ncbi:HD-GYP domain-containing protein [Candidatus Saccharibacteria bacterium]|nr:HD-GYP domain-containing protein [Candidatus Saccharibacteria bacterium]